MKILILDTETTGFVAPQPIEMAYLSVNYPGLGIQTEYHQRFNPTKDIEYGAMATHNIVIEDLQNSPSTTECCIPVDVDYLIGHNIDYDWKVLGQPNVKRIDTLAMSRYLFPEVDSHTQSAMLYYFLGAEARPLVKEAHSALYDVYNCLRLLQELLDVCANRGIFLDTIEDLHAFSEIARIPTKITFGKFKGQPYTALDYGYVQWWLNKSDTKPDEYQLKALQLAGFKV